MEARLISELSDNSKNKAKIIILFQIFSCWLDFNEFKINWHNLNILFKYLEPIKFNEPTCICLLELVMKRLSNHDFSAFLCETCDRYGKTYDEKLLAILCLVVARLNSKKYNNFEILDKTNQTNVLDKILSDLNDFMLNISID